MHRSLDWPEQQTRAKHPDSVCTRRLAHLSTALPPLEAWYNVRKLTSPSKKCQLKCFGYHGIEAKKLFPYLNVSQYSSFHFFQRILFENRSSIKYASPISVGTVWSGVLEASILGKWNLLAYRKPFFPIYCGRPFSLKIYSYKNWNDVFSHEAFSSLMHSNSFHLPINWCFR